MISLFVSNSDEKNTSKNGSQVSLSLNPAISLDPDKKYYASCVECDITYCFANIFTNKNDQFVYSEMKNGTMHTFTHTFSQGLYTINAIQQEINRCTQSDVQNNYLFVLEPDTSTSHVFVHFMSNTAVIDCSGDDNVMQILGYPSDSGEIGPVTYVNDFYEGDNAQLNNIQNILVLASFVNGSYYNSQSKNVLASITPDVAPYTIILYRPQQSIYVPVNNSILDTITFQLVDQDGNELNMGVHEVEIDKPERWSMRVIIKEIDKV